MANTNSSILLQFFYGLCAAAIVGMVGWAANSLQEIPEISARLKTIEQFVVDARSERDENMKFRTATDYQVKGLNDRVTVLEDYPCKRCNK